MKFKFENRIWLIKKEKLRGRVLRRYLVKFWNYFFNGVKVNGKLEAFGVESILEKV